MNHLRVNFIFVLLIVFSLFTTSMVGAEEKIKASIKTNEVVNIPLFIEDADKHVPTDSATALYENRLHNPIVAPDRHHVTLGEFNAVTGTAKAKCTDEGTRVRLSLDGLIPHGFYTIWNVTFTSPGFDPTFAHLSGVGAAGASDGSQNSFKASSNGRAHITAITPGGALSMLGSIGSCALLDEFEWHIVGAYHIDQTTHGGSVGPDGTYVEQFAFILNTP